MPNRVVTTSDSIAKNPIPKKNSPSESSANPPRSEASEVEGKGLTMAELVDKLGKTRQAIESARDKGTLGEFGYRASKVGRNWLYWAVEVG